MAVYTNISLIELNEFLDLYSIGKADNIDAVSYTHLTLQTKA